MLGSIFFKEYLKIRWLWLTLFVINGLIMIYIYIDYRHIFAMNHAEIVWYRVLHLGHIHYVPLKYSLVVTGLMLAFIQFLPEMTGERLRLSLHLPVSPHKLVLAHITVGLTALGLVIALDLAALAQITARYFPAEGVTIALLTALPWSLAGFAAYLGVTLGLLEPSYKLKLLNMAVSAGVVGLFLFPVEPAGYLYLLPNLTLPVLLMIPAVLLPAYRFRYRRAS